MKNPFKRKTKKVKLSKGHKFLEGLHQAVYLNKNQEKFEETFFTILEKADDPELSRKARMRYRTLLENIEKAEKKKSEPNFKFDKEFVLGQTQTHSNINIDTLKAAIEESAKNPNIFIDENYYNQLEGLRKSSKLRKWFRNVKLSIKENWGLAKEFGREIQYWLIAEYKIFTKLSYALNRKKSEVKVRKAFNDNKSMFINKHGYDKGTQLFNDFSASINNGVQMHKRMVKIGY